MFFLSFLIVNQAQAVTYAEFYNIEDMTDLAHDVLSGEVLSIQSALVNGAIESTITVKIAHNYVGNKKNTVSFTVLGGELNGITMTVPGAPQFKVGQQTLLFLENEKIVGFGQGAYQVDDNAKASRSLQNELPDQINTLDIKKELPDESAARSCLEVKVWDDYDDDWSMRTIEVDHLSNEEYKAYPLTILAGMEYEFLACTDEKADQITISLYDNLGEIIQSSSHEGREGRLQWHSEETQSIFLSIQTQSYAQDVKQVGTSVAILYR